MQASQHGFLGINIYTFGFVPYTDSTADIVATQRANDYYIGWWVALSFCCDYLVVMQFTFTLSNFVCRLVNPLIYGDYPDIMTKNGGNRIPVFTPAESKLIKGSFDFFGLNHYTPLYVKDNPSSLKKMRDVTADMAIQIMCKIR